MQQLSVWGVTTDADAIIDRRDVPVVVASLFDKRIHRIAVGLRFRMRMSADLLGQKPGSESNRLVDSARWFACHPGRDSDGSDDG